MEKKEKIEKQQKNEKIETVSMSLKLDRQLHTLLKLKAVKEQKTLKELMLQILQKYVKE